MSHEKASPLCRFPSCKADLRVFSRICCVCFRESLNARRDICQDLTSVHAERVAGKKPAATCICVLMQAEFTKIQDTSHLSDVLKPWEEAA